MDLPPETLVLARRVSALSYRWGWAEETYVCDADDPVGLVVGRLEHFLHEVSHVVDLGLDQIHARTQNEVSLLVPEDIRVGRWFEPKLAAEARALAIEFRCWELLGLPLGRDTLRDLAEVQDVDDERLDAALSVEGLTEKAEAVLRLVRETVDREGVS